LIGFRPSPILSASETLSTKPRRLDRWRVLVNVSESRATSRQAGQEGPGSFAEVAGQRKILGDGSSNRRIFADVDQNSIIAQEEIFGPVVSIIDYDTVDEAIGIANNSDFGLNGSVFTTDLEKGLGVAARIHTGTVELNGSPAGFGAPRGWREKERTRS